MGKPEKITAWQMTSVGKPLEKKELDVPELKEGDVLVQVAGCGVCHTDISFLFMGVKTKSSPPLTLGHEVSGIVVDAGGAFKSMVGKEVIVPAVLPCGECALCKSGRGNICQSQVMPGNDMNGGFASHMAVPGRYVCVLERPVEGYDLAELSVVADAVTTPYHAVKKAGLKAGEVAVQIGVGGIGTYGVQVAKATGAHVVALDIDDRKLEAVKGFTDAVFNVKDKTVKDVRGFIRNLLNEKKWPTHGVRIFETSGTAAGQDLGFNLLGFAGSMSIVGFTMDRVQVRLSNLMAFDADLHGNWGCLPEYYNDVVELIRQKKIDLKPFIENHPLDEINKILEMAHHGQLSKRAIMIP